MDVAQWFVEVLMGEKQEGLDQGFGGEARFVRRI